jgi:hypothetical protein
MYAIVYLRDVGKRGHIYKGDDKLRYDKPLPPGAEPLLFKDICC